MGFLPIINCAKCNVVTQFGSDLSANDNPHPEGGHPFGVNDGPLKRFSEPNGSNWIGYFNLKVSDFPPGKYSLRLKTEIEVSGMKDGDSVSAAFYNHTNKNKENLLSKNGKEVKTFDLTFEVKNEQPLLLLSFTPYIIKGTSVRVTGKATLLELTGGPNNLKYKLD
jgi:hypothetical protein